MLVRMCGMGVALAAVSMGPAWAGPQEGHDPAQAAIGQKAPAFTLTSSEGKQVSLSDFAGKVVVLEWTNHECPVVNRYVAQGKTMQKTLRSFAGKDVVWLAIDSSYFCEEKKDAINAWRRKVGTEYPMLLDATGQVGHAYGAKTTPHMFVIDKNGVLAYMGSMDDDRHGGAESPHNYVEEAVNALLAGSAVPTSRTQSFGCTVKYKK